MKSVKTVIVTGIKTLAVIVVFYETLVLYSQYKTEEIILLLTGMFLMSFVPELIRFAKSEYEAGKKIYGYYKRKRGRKNEQPFQENASLG